MNVLRAFVIGLVVGLVVWLLAGMIPLFAPYAQVLGFIAFLLATVLNFNRPVFHW